MKERAKNAYLPRKEKQRWIECKIFIQSEIPFEGMEPTEIIFFSNWDGKQTETDWMHTYIRA